MQGPIVLDGQSEITLPSVLAYELAAVLRYKANLTPAAP
jgi:hypothetical protein